MKGTLIVISVLFLAAIATLAFLHLRSQWQVAGPVVHVENEFEFTVHGPYKTVAPLFGASAERAWGEGQWNPRFLYPSPEHDTFGEVFIAAHGHLRSVWVNSAFDLEKGHVQYVYVIPDAQAVLIDIHLQDEGPSATGVKVVYQRTALNPRFNAHVTEIGNRDRDMGKEWQTAIDASLQGNAR
ncbi:MAG: hypothetical protein ABSB65_01070 [Candidatus Acidiferrales bacterium]